MLSNDTYLIVQDYRYYRYYCIKYVSFGGMVKLLTKICKSDRHLSKYVYKHRVWPATGHPHEKFATPP